MSDPMHIPCPNCGATNRVPTARLGDKAICGRCKQPLFTGKPVTVTQANYRQLIGSDDVPFVIDFWAPWCGPCRSFAPVFEAAAAELEPAVRLGKLDTEAEPEVAAAFGIRSIPTLILFRGGREISRQSGAMDRAGFTRWVKTSTEAA